MGILQNLVSEGKRASLCLINKLYCPKTANICDTLEKKDCSVCFDFTGGMHPCF